MKKQKTNINTKITKKHLKIAIGICICLASIFCMLNYGYVSGFIFWCVSFFVGSLFSYIFYGLVFLYGLKFIIQKKFTIRNLNLLIVGLVIICTGVLIITTHEMTLANETVLTFKNFRTEFIKSLNLNEFPKLRLDQSGGIIGLTLVAILNSTVQPLGTIIFSSILICVGTCLLLARPVIYLVKSISDDKKDLSLNQKAAMEYEEEVGLLSGNVNLSRDGNLDYTEEDAKNDKPIISAMPYAQPEVKEESKPVPTLFENPEPLPETVYEPLEETKKEESKPLIEPDEDEKTLIPHYDNSNENYNNFVDNSLHRVRFNPDEDFSPKEVKPAEIKSQSDNVIQNSYEPEPTFNDTPVEEPIVATPISEFYKEEKEEIPEPEIVHEEVKNEEVIKPVIPSNPVYKEEKVVSTSQIPTPTPISKPEPVTQVKPVAPKVVPHIKYQPAPSDLLDESVNNDEVEGKNIDKCKERMAVMNDVLQDFKIGAQIVSFKIGPSVTRFDLKTERNYSVQGIDKYMNDLSVRLRGVEARFVPIIQGKTTSGIEIANESRAIVKFKDVFNNLPRVKPGKLEIPFGVNISGDYISADLTGFPHLLVAGTTGSGKSIYIHSVILSLIMRNSMEDLRLVMVDPKCVEFRKYEGIPHLLCPIITDANEAYATLVRLAEEMDDRFQLFGNAGVSDIKEYNEMAVEKGLPKIPLIVLIIDEFADLMDNNKAIQNPVSRLGAKARAAGIHMIIATQRPSTDVITGTIKSNLGVRVALMTSSPTDSMVVLGEGGAEKLLGHGDMLVSCPAVSKQEKTRVQGCLVTNSEIQRVCNHIREKYPLVYDDRFVGLLEKSRLEATDLNSIVNGGASSDEESPYETVKQSVIESERETISISYICNTFHFGYKRSADIYNKLIDDGILEKPQYSNSAKGAKILVHAVDEQMKDHDAEE